MVLMLGIPPEILFVFSFLAILIIACLAIFYLARNADEVVKKLNLTKFFSRR